jgi:hypothetical protein
MLAHHGHWSLAAQPCTIARWAAAFPAYASHAVLPNITTGHQCASVLFVGEAPHRISPTFTQIIELSGLEGRPIGGPSKVLQ